jgi:hypothetical protein
MMLTHSIEVHKPLYVEKVRHAQQPTRRWKGREGTEDHKEFIFNRARGDCKFEEAEVVLYKRNPCLIMNILENMDQMGMEWDGLKPKFIECWLEGTDKFFMAHPSDLKRPRNK